MVVLLPGALRIENTIGTLDYRLYSGTHTVLPTTVAERRDAPCTVDLTVKSNHFG